MGLSLSLDTYVLKQDTYNHYCFVLRKGCKAIGLMCCVMRVKESSYTTSLKRMAFAAVFLAVAADCTAAHGKPLQGAI